MSQTLLNLQHVMNGLLHLRDLNKRVRNMRGQDRRADQEAAIAAEKRRYQKIFEERNKGLTFREIGEICNVNAGRAGQLFTIAASMARRGTLYND